jgi:CelD/BcsL family acetyltransferase involved in cellulose biosynthesis
MLRITLSVPTDIAALEGRWRALEAAAEPSFFQSWSWVGCAAAERFRDPLLIEAHDGGIQVAIGLFNRQHRPIMPPTLWLNEAGDRSIDIVFVEHNGLLVRRGRADALDACFARLRRRHVVLDGIGSDQLDAAERVAIVRHRRRSLPAPWVDLVRVRASPGGHLAGLSANTRQQLRRSLRQYAATGPLAVRRAESLDEARAYFAALGALHQRSWNRRARPGVFAAPGFARFHAELLDRAFARGEIDLLHVTAGATTIGYLYNFRHNGRISAYQSGFNYDAAGPHQKPGLTCHHLAIEMYAATGAASYDLLAGDDRYKHSLAYNSTTLHWIEMMPPTTAVMHGAAEAVRSLAHRVMRRHRLAAGG